MKIARIHVSPVSHPSRDPGTQPQDTCLAQLGRGVQARVLALDVDGDLQARLCALGMTPGKSVRVLRRAAFGHTLHLRVGSTEFMIRHVEAAHIRVRTEPAALPGTGA